MNAPQQISDIEIGRRLREFRESLKIPRTVFAFEIGIGGERLASYETGRVSLKWGVFLAIMRRFHLNPLWLATGQYLQQIEVPLIESGLVNIDPRKKLCEVVEILLGVAGTPKSFELEQKIGRTEKLMVEILDDAKAIRAPGQILERLAHVTHDWNCLAVDLAQATKDKLKKQRFDSLLSAPLPKQK